MTLFMNSAMPNRPSASATISTPSNRLGMPKVNRGVPVSMSLPTMPISRPQHGHGDALERRTARQRRAGQQAEQHQRTDFGRTEFKRHHHQDRRQEDHLGDAPRGADERRDDGDAERGAAPAFFGEREAVETGDRVRRMAWQIEQDRADRAAVLRAVENARQHQDGADRLDAEGERQQDRDGGERAHARQHADHVADEHADEAPHHVVRLERDAEAVPEICAGRWQTSVAKPEHGERNLQHVGEQQRADDRDAGREDG